VSLDDLLANGDIARLARALEHTPGRPVEPEAHFQWAAIAVTLRMGDAGEPELLMIKRAEHAGDPWSGHVACPGGRMEPGDADLSTTAIRETREELGVDLARDGRILGTLDDLYPRTPLLPPIVIRPFVAAVSAQLAIEASDEVASWFWVPLSAIREPRAWGTGTVVVRGMTRQERTFTYGEHQVWGLTERVLRQLGERLG
jgi:8-oxo-dGTP pyrophosphatase MutT (NUDIX family)